MKIFLNQNEKNTSGLLLLSDLFYESLISKGWVLSNDDDLIYETIRERRPHMHEAKGKYQMSEEALQSIHFRTHPDVLATIEDIGLEACIHQNARPSEKAILKMVEIPDDIPVDTLYIEFCSSDFLTGGYGIEYLAEKEKKVVIEYVEKRIWK